MEKEDKTLVKNQFLHATVVKVFSTMSKFLNYFFAKAQGEQSEFNSVICEVPVIGFFTFERGQTADKFDFIPSTFFIQESGINTDRKSLQLNLYAEPYLKKAISGEKIAQLCGIKHDMCMTILTNIVKEIVSRNR